MPNLALIIGPYSPDLADPIRKAAGIIRSNMAAGRIPSDGFLLMSSVPYENIGVDKARAELKSRFLARFAADVIRQEFADLAPGMTIADAMAFMDAEVAKREETLRQQLLPLWQERGWAADGAAADPDWQRELCALAL